MCVRGEEGERGKGGKDKIRREAKCSVLRQV